jgi:hypothetical protein
VHKTPCTTFHILSDFLVGGGLLDGFWRLYRKIGHQLSTFIIFKLKILKDGEGLESYCNSFIINDMNLSSNKIPPNIPPAEQGLGLLPPDRAGIPYGAPMYSSGCHFQAQAAAA